MADLRGGSEFLSGVDFPAMILVRMHSAMNLIQKPKLPFSLCRDRHLRSISASPDLLSHESLSEKLDRLLDLVKKSLSKTRHQRKRRSGGDVLVLVTGSALPISRKASEESKDTEEVSSQDMLCHTIWRLMISQYCSLPCPPKAVIRS